MAQAALKAELKKILPEDLFKKTIVDEKGNLIPLPAGASPLYKDFDGEGMPTTDANGEPLTKSKLKNLKKELDKHKKMVAQK